MHGKIPNKADCKFKLNIKIGNHNLDAQNNGDLEFSVHKSSPAIVICSCVPPPEPINWEIEMINNFEDEQELNDEGFNAHEAPADELFEEEIVEHEYVVEENEIVEEENDVNQEEIGEDENDLGEHMNETGENEDEIDQGVVGEANDTNENVVEGNGATENVIENSIAEVAMQGAISENSRGHKRPVRAASTKAKMLFSFNKRQKL